MAKYTRTCPTCNVSFISSYKDRQWFCSRACYDQSRKIRIEKVCEYCSKSFIATTSHAAQRRFCSYSCSNKVMHGKENSKEVRTCEQCGEAFEEWSYRPTRFCSMQCSGDWYSESHSGKNSVHWKGGKKYDRGKNWNRQRNQAKKRDGNSCQICGYKKKKSIKRDIDVHHIISYYTFCGDYKTANELNNLITLCRTCHFKVEYHGLPCPRPLL